MIEKNNKPSCQRINLMVCRANIAKCFRAFMLPCLLLPSHLHRCKAIDSSYVYTNQDQSKIEQTFLFYFQRAMVVMGCILQISVCILFIACRTRVLESGTLDYNTKCQRNIVNLLLNLIVTRHFSSFYSLTQHSCFVICIFSILTVNL